MGPAAPRRRAYVALCGLAMLLSACSTVRVPGGLPPSDVPPIDAYARVLEKHVDERGFVDFPALASEPKDLHRYVAYVAEVDPEEPEAGFATPEARLAHYINAYNALAMYGVLDLGLPYTNAGLRKFRFFFLRRYPIGGRVQSLHAYETAIRELGDERIHFALNCMSIGCPRLPREPFEESSLERALQGATVEFFSDPKHLVVDDESRTVRVSSILDFYTGDFLAKAPSLIGYINRYRVAKIPDDYAVEFIPYDWTINSSKPLR
jgi:hypothetical protein